VNPSRRKKSTGARVWGFIPAVAVLAFLFIAASQAAAGYPDKDKLATGTPETKLSGITVGIQPLGTQLPNGTPISEIIKLYGPTTSQEDAVVPDGAGGTRFYKWEWPGLRMSVATYFYYVGGEQRTMVESHPAYIDVWGDAPKGELGVTGRGLQLGATLEQQKALYGDRYTLLYAEKGTTSVQLDWEDGTELMIDYGSTGHSNHIRLTCREK
jgi:hypothetical protein